MSREWATPLSILGGSVIVALGLYFGLRPAPAPTDAPERATQGGRAAGDDDARRVESPFAERDRRRAIEEDATSEGVAVPAPETARRDEREPTEAEQAMAVAAPLPADPDAPDVAGRVEKDSAEAFESIRDEVRKCWDGLPDDPDAPSSVSVDLSLSYDASGTLVASGVSELRESRRDGLAACLGPIVHDMRIPAPGANTSVQVRVTIP